MTFFSFFGFFEIPITDPDSASNFELERGLNGCEQIFGH